MRNVKELAYEAVELILFSPEHKRDRGTILAVLGAGLFIIGAEMRKDGKI